MDRITISARICTLIGLLLLAGSGTANAAPRLVEVGTFNQPVAIAAPAGDSRVFVVERFGRVQVVEPGGTRSVFLDATDYVENGGDRGERGMLSIAFAPDYAASGKFYVFYTAKDPNKGNLVVREGIRTADPGKGVLSGRLLVDIPHPVSNHNGGQLAFGPDGYLYASTGDGSEKNDENGYAADPSSRLGKILRINTATGSVENWAQGLRNPWRFSFDRQTGDTLIGDVGQAGFEEVNFAPAGAPSGRDYGWSSCEGNYRFDRGTGRPSSQPCPSQFVRPSLALPYGEYRSVIGGFVVRDPALPTLVGRYLFGDIAQPKLLSAVVDRSGARDMRVEQGLPVDYPTAFGEDGSGRIYVASFRGAVYRVEDPSYVAPMRPSMPPPPLPGLPGTLSGPLQHSAREACQLRVTALRSRARGKRPRITRTSNRPQISLRTRARCKVVVRAKRFKSVRLTVDRGKRRVVRLTPTRKGVGQLRKQLKRRGVTRVRVRTTFTTTDPAGKRRSAHLRINVR